VDPTLKATTLNQFLYSYRLNHVLPGQYTTLDSIADLTSAIGLDLTSLDVFSDIQATLQPSQNSSSSSFGPGGSSNNNGLTMEDVDVVLSCKEKGNYFIKTSSDVGNGEGNATIQARIRNLFGGAERAEFSATMGTKTRRAFDVSSQEKERERQGKERQGKESEPV
jgi:outer membrane protein insertion porin family